MSVLKLNNVSIRYMTGDFKDIGIKEYIIRKLKGDYHVREFWADRGISFSLEKGDMLGIIGANGAGKSTLLKVVTGIMEPTEGSAWRKGNIAALLELASGFDGDLTVKENTYLRGAMLGYTREFMNETYSQIISFAELEDFEDRPFKQLSSGMKSRLAFSIASLVNPDILILDEVLSVGDGAFRKKSEAKMREIINSGATTILVSHSLAQVREMCTKILWLHKGAQIAFGDNVQGICNAYQAMLNQQGEAVFDPRLQWLSSIEPLSVTEQPQSVAVPVGEKARFHVEVTGSGPISYRWQYFDITLSRWCTLTSPSYDGLDSATMSVPSLISRNDLKYRCLITGPAGSIYSEIATLTVKPAVPLLVTVHPENITAKLGTTAEFHAEANHPDLRYQWEYYDTAQKKWLQVSSSAYEGVNSSTMKVPAVVSRNGLRYRCRISDTLSRVYSDSASLSVIPSLPLAIVKQPQSVIQEDGKIAAFSVEASGFHLKYQWQNYNSSREKWHNVTSPDYSGIHAPTMSVPVSAERNGYRYRCKISDDFGSVYSEPVTLMQAEHFRYNAFLTKMRQKAASIGAVNTLITSASGLNKTTLSNALDMLKVTTAAAAYRKLWSIWGEKVRYIDIQGPNARTEVIETTVTDEFFESHYRILGGKTGTLERNDDSYYYSLNVVAMDRQGRMFAGSVFDATYRWRAMKKLFDKMSKALDDPAYDPYADAIPETRCCVGWQLLPDHLEGKATAEPKILYSQNAEEEVWTASTIKTLSMITALDYLKDLDGTYTIRECDVKKGSGNVFMAGDIVSIEDLFYAAMLPSSNTAANAIAHYVGEIILRQEKQD